MTNEEALTRIEYAEQNLDNDEQFRETVSDVMGWLEVENIVLANELAVSTTTVQRWKLGTAVPFPAMRKPVYRVLKRHIEAKSP